MNSDLVDDQQLIWRALTAATVKPNVVPGRPSETHDKEYRMKRAIVGLLVFALASPQTWADLTPDQKHIESVRKKVAECVDKQRRVVVETYDDRRLQGSISEAGATDFILSFSGRSTRLSYDDVKRIKWQSPVLRQVKVAVAAAAIVGTLVGLLVLIGGLKG